MHAFVRGHVQGVFFRDTTRKFALRLGLVGTVRNMSDGGVEIFAQGEREVLEQLITELKANGPGKIDEVEFKFQKASRSFQEFQILY